MKVRRYHILLGGAVFAAFGVIAYWILYLILSILEGALK